MRIAVEGCCHGELDKIYGTLQKLEAKQKFKIDLLICCGDFQAVRNEDDLECLACPPKYRDVRTFYQYYNGEKKAPYPTLFIGGNHEASNHLWELYYGGWVAPNIYYLGHSGVVNFGGLRIGGLSGIYNERHYQMGHFEGPPYNESTMRSAYHVRELEVFRLAQLKRTPDVFLSHDWPHSIAYHGDTQQLFRAKKHLISDAAIYFEAVNELITKEGLIRFQVQIETGQLGNPPAKRLMEELKPKFWFSAHHHIKFAALFSHQDNLEPPNKKQKAEEGIKETGEESKSNSDPMFTRFLALDKCIPNRRFLQTLDFPEAKGPHVFSYDEEWLAIIRDTHRFLSLERTPKSLPGYGNSREFPSTESLQWVRNKFQAKSEGYNIPENFQQTVQAYNPSQGRRKGKMPQQEIQNPQTLEFLNLLGLDYTLAHKSTGGEREMAPNPEEIQLGEGDDSDANPEEIALLEYEENEENPEEINIDDFPDK